MAPGQSAPVVQGGGVGEGEQAQDASKRRDKRAERRDKGRMVRSLSSNGVRALVGVVCAACVGEVGRRARGGALGKRLCKVLVDGGVWGKMKGLLDGEASALEMPQALVVLGGEIEKPRCAFFEEGRCKREALKGLLDGAVGLLRGEMVVEQKVGEQHGGEAIVRRALHPLCEKRDGLGSFVLLMEAVGLPIEKSAEGWGVLVGLGGAPKVFFGLEGAFLDAKQPAAPYLGCILPNRRGLKKERL